ncbi:MAG: glycosyl hydrolase family protein, partial [Proteobacteria bacterium]
DSFRIGAEQILAFSHSQSSVKELGDIQNLGLQTLRFPISWAEILPSGRITVKQPVLDNYDRLVDLLLERSLKPIADLSLSTLPEPLEDKGGWINRDSIYWFSDFAALLADTLGDRIKEWMTHSDPFLNSKTLYRDAKDEGEKSPRKAWVASHHLLLSHPYARDSILAERADSRVGFGLKYWPVFPASDRTRDHLAAERFETEHHAYYLDLLCLGRYSEAALHLAKFECGDTEFLIESDKFRIHDSADFIHLDYEFMPVIDVADPESFTRKGKLARTQSPKTEPYSDRRSSERLLESLIILQDKYSPRALTLSSASKKDGHEDFLLYHSHHLEAVREAIENKVPLQGYEFKKILQGPQSVIHPKEDGPRDDRPFWLRSVIETRDPEWNPGIIYKELD